MTNETIIYLRTSTEEQNPENQLKECLSVCPSQEYTLLQEQKSAWKVDEERVEFEKVLTAIKKKHCDSLVVWDLDRIYRNRKKLVSFFELCKIYKCKIYSYRQKFLEDINKAPEPWNEMLFSNMIFILGWIAEEESKKKSERIRAAMRRDETGRITSYKGNVWGRKEVPQSTQEEIIKLHEQGKNYREICQLVFYWDASRHRKNVSMGYVHKVLNNNKRSLNRTESGSTLSNL